MPECVFIPSKGYLKGSEAILFMVKFENLHVRFAIFKVTESLLVVTAGLPMVESCGSVSRELWATSGTHFSTRREVYSLGRFIN